MNAFARELASFEEKYKYQANTEKEELCWQILKVNAIRADYSCESSIESAIDQVVALGQEINLDFSYCLSYLRNKLEILRREREEQRRSEKAERIRKEQEERRKKEEAEYRASVNDGVAELVKKLCKRHSGKYNYEYFLFENECNIRDSSIFTACEEQNPTIFPPPYACIYAMYVEEKKMLFLQIMEFIIRLRRTE